MAFRHSGWTAQRRRVFDAIWAVHGEGSRLTRFDDCGSDAWVVRDAEDPNRLRIQADLCHDRFCTPCGNARSRLIAANLAAFIPDRPHRFITLTLFSDDHPLQWCLDKLYLCFARLRRGQLWKQHVTGGAAFCEIAYSLVKRRWHVHLHVIAAGTFLPKQQLSDAWLAVTKDSYIVDISLIRDHDECLAYVTKYASKPLAGKYTHQASLLQEAVRALKGRRLCLCFGTWHTARLTESLDDTTWVHVERLSDLRARAQIGDADAQRVFLLLGCPNAYLPSPPEDPNTWDQ